MNWKGCGRKQSWPDFSYYHRICLKHWENQKKEEKLRIVGALAEM
jgi:hypothetical protein